MTGPDRSGTWGRPLKSGGRCAEHGHGQQRLARNGAPAIERRTLGTDDERGTLNHITAQTVVNASRLVQSGRVVSAAHDVNFSVTPSNPRPGLFQMLFREDRASAADSVTIPCHGYAMTHIDALCHVALDGLTYNNRKAEEVVTRDGLTFGSVLPLADGIVTRGVLLDVPRSVGNAGWTAKPP